MCYRSLNFARKKTIKLPTLKGNNPWENLLCEIVKFWNQVVYANSRMIIKNRSKDNCVIRLFNMLHCINIRILILVLIYKTSLTSPLFIEVSVPSHESDRTVMYVCVRGIKLASVFTTLVFLFFCFCFVCLLCVLLLFLLLLFLHFIYNSRSI
jgi:hypothetical protein